MQLTQLQYAVEIERCGSITDAAKTLFVAQPNLSKSLRELEEELGIRIFFRTARGVVPTAAGKKFLSSAREILQKMEDLKNDASLDCPGRMRFHFTASPYIDCVPLLAEWLAEQDMEQTGRQTLWDISFSQTSSLCAIDQLVAGESELALLCFPEAYERFFQQQFTKNQLYTQLLELRPFQLLMRTSHPLAGQEEIIGKQLEDYPQLQLDFSLPALSPRQRRDLVQFLPARRTLRFSDRDSALTALSQLQDGYLWFPKASPQLLSRYHLCQRSCPQAGKYRIAVVTPGYQPSSRRAQRLTGWIVERLVSQMAGQE